MPWRITKNSTGDKKYTLTSLASGKKYHTNEPKKLERLHEYFKNHKGGE